MTAQELAELRQPKAHNDTATCKYVKDELVNGEMRRYTLPTMSRPRA